MGKEKENIMLYCLRFSDDLAVLANGIKETREQITSLEELARKNSAKILLRKQK